MGHSRTRPGPCLPLAAGLLLLGMALGLFWRALFAGETFIERDLTTYYRAAKSLVVPLVRASGGLPLWNPFFGSGQPFAANPEHEIFHPATALLFLLPFEWAFRLQIILPLFVGAGAMFVLLRTLRRSRPGALFGGLTWGFGGYLLSTTNLLPILFAASVLPLVLSFAVHVARKPGAASIAGLALTVGLVCLAGEPSTLMMMPILGGAAVLADRARPDRRGTTALAAGLILGICVGAATLLPGAHHAGKTIRATGLPDSAANEWSMPPVRILDLVAPNVLGHVDRSDEKRYWGGSLYPGKHFAFFYSLYPGLLASVLGVAAWIRRRRALAPWLVVACVGYLVALGEHFPLWGLLRRLPLMAGLRYPEKFALLFILPLTVASAHGFDQIILGPGRARRPVMRVLLGFGLAGAVLAGILCRDAGLRIALPDAIRLGCAALASLAVIRLAPRLGRTRLALSVCALGALDLLAAGQQLVKTAPIAAVKTPPVVLRPLLAQPADERLFHLAAWDPDLSIVGGLAAPPVPAQWGLATTLEVDFDMTFLRWTNQATDLFWDAVRADQSLAQPLLRRRGVTAVLKFRDGVRWEGKHLWAPGGATPLELLRTSAPFAFAAARIEIVDGDSAWLATMRRLGQKIPETACVDSTEHLLVSDPPSPATVTVARRTPTRIWLDVDARGPTPSFVAINQTWDDGWRATVDDAPARLLRTDISLSGVQIPLGRHRLELSYRDPWLEAGLAASLFAVLACVALAFIGRRARA